MNKIVDESAPHKAVSLSYSSKEPNTIVIHINNEGALREISAVVFAKQTVLKINQVNRKSGTPKSK